jgi:hypothetical protein
MGIPSIQFVFAGWWLACTGFVAFGLPLLDASQVVDS